MHQARKTLFSLLWVVGLGFTGIALPYPIMANLFLDTLGSPLTHSELLPPAILLGIVLAAYPFGQFIGSPWLGALSDTFGRKRILMASLAGTFLGMLASGVAIVIESYLLLVCSRLFTGFCEGHLPIARAAAADLAPTISKTKAFSYINAATNIGWLIGPILGGIFASQSLSPHFSPQLPFYIGAGLTLATIVVVWFLFNEKGQTQTSNEAISHSIKQHVNAMNAWAVLKNPHLRYMMFCSFFITLGFDIFYAYYPYFLVSKWQFATIDIAYATLVLTGAMVISNLTLVSLAERKLRIEQSLLFSGLTYAIAVSLVILPSHGYSFVVTFFLVGLCISLAGTFYPVEISNLASVRNQGKVMGVMMSMRFLGETVIALVGGVLASMAFYYPIVASSIFALIGTVLYAASLRSAYHKRTLSRK